MSIFIGIALFIFLSRYVLVMFLSHLEEEMHHQADPSQQDSDDAMLLETSHGVSFLKDEKNRYQNEKHSMKSTEDLSESQRMTVQRLSDERQALADQRAATLEHRPLEYTIRASSSISDIAKPATVTPLRKSNPNDKQINAWRQAIIMKEILDRPKALRD